MMFSVSFQKQMMSFTIMTFLLFSSISSKGTINLKQNHSTLEKNLVILESKDMRSANYDTDHTYMQLKDTPEKKRARAFAAKWATTYKHEMNYKPFHVKTGDENIPHWKNYLVLLTGDKENYLLKKVCFSSETSNLGIVLDSSESCNKEVNFL